MAKGKSVLTTGEVARICNVAPRTVSKWFDSGQLKGYRIPGSKDRRIPLEELIRFMRQHNIPLKGLATGKTRVLIIHGSRSIAESMAQQIQQAGQYEVHIADDTFHAGLAMERFCPHAVVVDLLSKDIDAICICKAIRSDDQLQSIKVVAITGKLGPSERQALYRKGFDECVEQGSIGADLIRVLEDAIALVY